MSQAILNSFREQGICLGQSRYKGGSERNQVTCSYDNLEDQRLVSLLFTIRSIPDSSLYQVSHHSFIRCSKVSKSWSLIYKENYSSVSPQWASSSLNRQKILPFPLKLQWHMELEGWRLHVGIDWTCDFTKLKILIAILSGIQIDLFLNHNFSRQWAHLNKCYSLDL